MWELIGIVAIISIVGIIIAVSKLGRDYEIELKEAAKQSDEDDSRSI